MKTQKIKTRIRVSQDMKTPLQGRGYGSISMVVKEAVGQELPTLDKRAFFEATLAMPVVRDSFITIDTTDIRETLDEKVAQLKKEGLTYKVDRTSIIRVSLFLYLNRKAQEEQDIPFMGEPVGFADEYGLEAVA